jgi:hypothetical protein
VRACVCDAQVRYATRPGDFRISVIPYNLRRRITFKHFVVVNTEPYRGEFVWLQVGACAACVACRVVSCRVVSCRVVSCRVVSCRVCAAN